MLDFVHALGDAPDRLDGARGRALHSQDLADDRFGRLGGLHRQRFDFRSDDGEAAAGLAGAGRFDGGVERQQIGLLGDGLNELDAMSPIFCAESASVVISPLVDCASSTAMRTTSLVWAICRAISAIEVANSSVA
jgi:hypothetical protein